MPKPVYAFQCLCGQLATPKEYLWRRADTVCPRCKTAMLSDYAPVTKEVKGLMAYPLPEQDDNAMMRMLKLKPGPVGQTCGTCGRRVNVVLYGTKRNKCTLYNTRSASTNLVLAWPACERWQPADNSRRS